MTDPSMDIAKYINANESGWFSELKMSAETSGHGNLFAGDLPDSPEFAVAIIRYEGRGPTETFENP